MIEYIPAKTIVSSYAPNASWFGINYNMNIYKGCCHGCIYCDSRSECYHVDNFDSVRAKENALEIIRNDLRRKAKPGVIGTGAMSDPYNPFERELLLTRHALELIDAYDFGVAIATKSDLILRDIDLLQSIKTHSPVLCKVTITTCDDDLCRKLEPNVAVSSRRFAVLRELNAAGIFAGILLMPVLPFLEDNTENVRGIVERARESGARFIYPAFGMTLRANQREWYYSKLDALFPAQGLRQQYTRRYGDRYECPSPHAKNLWGLFTAACDACGMLYKMQDIVSGYRQGYAPAQLSFF